MFKVFNAEKENGLNHYVRLMLASGWGRQTANIVFHIIRILSSSIYCDCKKKFNFTVSTGDIVEDVPPPCAQGGEDIIERFQHSF